MTQQAGVVLMMISVIALTWYIDEVYGEEVGEKFIMWLITAAIVGAVLFGHR